MEPIISLNQVSKSFSGRRVLSDVSLDIGKEAPLASLGPMGVESRSCSILSAAF